MTTNPPRPDDLSRQLDAALGLEPVAADERAIRHVTLRLHPVVLPPPPGTQPVAAAPDQSQPDFPSVTADDDIALDDDDDGAVRRRQLLLGAAGGGIALIGLVAYLIFGGSPAPQEASIPTIRADPSAQAKAPPPAPPTEAGDKSMGDISTELVPPTTDGLSPPRKVNAIRIIVENDREVVAPR